MENADQTAAEGQRQIARAEMALKARAPDDQRYGKANE